MLVDWNSDLYNKSRNRPLLDSINTHFVRFVSPHDPRTKKYITRRAKLEVLLMIVSHAFLSIGSDISLALDTLRDQWIIEDSADSSEE